MKTPPLRPLRPSRESFEHPAQGFRSLGTPIEWALDLLAIALCGALLYLILLIT